MRITDESITVWSDGSGNPVRFVWDELRWHVVAIQRSWATVNQWWVSGASVPMPDTRCWRVVAVSANKVRSGIYEISRTDQDWRMVGVID